MASGRCSLNWVWKTYLNRDWVVRHLHDHAHGGGRAGGHKEGMTKRFLGRDPLAHVPRETPVDQIQECRVFALEDPMQLLGVRQASPALGVGNQLGLPVRLCKAMGSAHSVSCVRRDSNAGQVAILSFLCRGYWATAEDAHRKRHAAWKPAGAGGRAEHRKSPSRMPAAHFRSLRGKAGTLRNVARALATC